MHLIAERQHPFVSFLENLKRWAGYLEAIEIIWRFVRIPLILLVVYITNRFSLFPSIDWPKLWWWILNAGQG
ncbi:MAG: hypothetical protein IT258_18505 [Saprospiraceae bacterium]|nr:hypothetical protein [Saprospiraceae bacterium]